MRYRDDLCPDCRSLTAGDCGRHETTGVSYSVDAASANQWMTRALGAEAELATLRAEVQRLKSAVDAEAQRADDNYTRYRMAEDRAITAESALARLPKPTTGAGEP